MGSGVAAIRNRLYLLRARRSGCVPRDDQGLQELRAIWGHHAAGGQGRGSIAEKNWWPLGPDSPSDDDAGHAYVGLLLAEPDPLGWSQGDPRSTARRMVGCQQDWALFSAD